ncbi:TetR/AcrR family transcriptional regulator [Demetria terragena]|uniref:TetR/AcrR family transcriptional regulator n=1 Tax=Demetria terragena TaxID=63959 RepID=UPI0003610CCB|nr:TetR/AcrR family transcriptional regulator [Demetria terragena]
MRTGQTTQRGAQTRARIVTAAADLVFTNGVRGTTLDEVMTASGTSKSQLYHYFADKEALVSAVILEQTRRVLAVHRPLLDTMESLEDMHRWRDAVVAFTRTGGGIGGCPIGSLASEMAEWSDSARIMLSHSFEIWETLLSDGLATMQARGELTPSASPRELATAVMAALQGGLLLTQVARNTQALELALDMALQHVANFVEPTSARRRGTQHTQKSL